MSDQPEHWRTGRQCHPAMERYGRGVSRLVRRFNVVGMGRPWITSPVGTADPAGASYSFNRPDGTHIAEACCDPSDESLYVFSVAGTRSEPAASGG